MSCLAGNQITCENKQHFYVWRGHSQMNKDLTVGKPEMVLWKFCLPLFGSIIFQQLYNIADSLVAGKFIGENALAAVGNSYEITLIFIAFRYRLPAFRRKGLRQAENSGIHRLYFQCFPLLCADACGYAGMRSAASPDPDAGGSIFRLPAVSGYLYLGTALCFLLQYCYRNLLRPGRFQDSLLLSCGILHLQYRCGYSVCKSF